ncbi:alpha/beta hydrolase family protein [Cellulomonas soli]|uniref:Peptidase S9 n=1 Tax=Cellulomonas soli TaxID=931535 RepID=A0A512PDB0_9CELL|nr:prolyl oligopeptidase family serine peptidase [Cellulomonas soli]NYI60150.1 dienelactone hydrolase [Cellulomonas soli]GEP69197.1 peptidase S9 [Cellulomonas soli]
MLRDEPGSRARAIVSAARGRRAYRMAASSAVGVLALAFLGSVMGPQWDPQPVTDPIEVETTSTTIGEAVQPGTYEVTQSVVTVRLDGVSVQARISEPVGAEGPLPAVVFVHGAGTGKYDEAFLAQAASLASHGIVAMVPDKRLDTYTTRHRDYAAMAADYARSVDLLREWPSVDPDRVGVYAESEGGWIAPVMAAQDPDLAFVVLVSSPVVPPRQQAAFAVDSYLRNTQVPHGVFRAIPRAVGMSLPGGGFEYADFDVTPYQRRMTAPVLVVYGTGDASMPIVQGAEKIVADAALAGNGDVTVRYYAGADHGIRVDGAVSEAFLRDLDGWVLGLPGTADASPRVAGDQPVQEYLAAPVPEPRWLRSGDVVLGSVFTGAGLIALGPVLVLGSRAAAAVAGAVRRRRGGGTVPDPAGRPAPPRYGSGVPWRIGALGLGALATVGVLVWYLVAIARLALDYERNALVVQGGWLLVRLLGIGAVVAGVALATRMHELQLVGRRGAPGAVRTIALWSGVVGAAVLLVVLAYWGAFQLGI